MICAFLLGLALATEPSNANLLQAAQQEVERSMQQLQLPQQPKPHLINYHIIDSQRHIAYAEFGEITSNSKHRNRIARVEVRVGSAQFDNTNFNGSVGSQNGIFVSTLPTENNPTALRRELWLATDRAYKGATEEYSAKLASLKGVTPSNLPDLIPGSPLITTRKILDPKFQFAADDWAKLLTKSPIDIQFIESISAVASHTQLLHHLISSEKTAAQLLESRTILRVEAIGRAIDGARLRNTRSWLQTDPNQLPTTEAIQSEVKDMLGWLQKLKDAPIEEDYLGPVIFEEQAAVELFRQLLPAELSANPPEAEPPDHLGEVQIVVPSSRIGRRLLPDKWQVTDDPTADPKLLGSYQYDYEGTRGQPVQLIENGIIRRLLMSRIPRADIPKSTGHGRSIGSARRIPVNSVVRVTPKKNCKMKHLRKKAKKLAAQTGQDYVLVVRRITPLALAEDFEVAFSGDGPLAGLTPPLEVYRLYRDGREQPVRGMRFVGVDRRVLRDIVLAGPQSRWFNLTDDAPGPKRYSIGEVNGLSVSWSAPSVLISELELRGQGGKEKRTLPPPQP